MLLQRCDDACDTLLMDHNGIAPKWVASQFSSNSIKTNEPVHKCHHSVIAVLTQTDSDTWCKRSLRSEHGQTVDVTLQI